MRRIFVSLGAALSLLLAFDSSAQSTAFTYQGRLEVEAAPAEGVFDLTFALYNDGMGGVQAGDTLSRPNVPITNGVFTVTLDFGNQITAVDRWLEIAVRTNGGLAFTALAPRQQITATPFAIRAANLTGPVSLGQLPQGVLTNNATSVTLAGTFGGSGAGFTNLPLAALGGGIFNQNTITSLNSELVYPSGGLSPSSAAAGDLNQDGRQDIAVANSGSGTVTILTNSGSGFVLAWTVIARAGAGSVLLADVNRDGRLDVLCVNSDNSIMVARALGNGLFDAATFHSAIPTAGKLAVGDLNGDFWPEIVAGTTGTNVLSIFVNNGSGSFPASPSSLQTTARNPAAIAFAELNGDFHADLIVAHGAGSGPDTNTVVYWGNGAGGFAASTAMPSRDGAKSLAIADINGDGLRDIVVGTGQSGARVEVFTNYGPGNFNLSQTITTSYIVSLTTGDFDGNGWQDVALTDAGFFGYTGMRMMLNDGAGRLAPAFHLTPFSYPSITAGDVDGGGKTELIVPNGTDPGSITVLRLLEGPEVVVTASTVLRGPLTVEEPAVLSDKLSFGSTTRTCGERITASECKAELCMREATLHSRGMRTAYTRTRHLIPVPAARAS